MPNFKIISVAGSIISSVRSSNNDHENNINPIKYLFNKFKHPFPNIHWFYTSTSETKNVIKSQELKTLVVTMKSLLKS